MDGPWLASVTRYRILGKPASVPEVVMNSSREKFMPVPADKIPKPQRKFGLKRDVLLRSASAHLHRAGVSQPSFRYRMLHEARS